MAELTNQCCAPAAQAGCCEPAGRDSCCGDQQAPGCGCAAGRQPSSIEDVREAVREKYSEAARAAATGSMTGCSPADTRDGLFGASLYADEDAAEPAVGASLGCGVPTAVADLHEGETVLDLRSGTIIRAHKPR